MSDAYAGLIRVFADGHLEVDGISYRCALGKGGTRTDKREGDGATPIGTYVLRKVHYRADKGAAPITGLPVVGTARDDGWCDDPKDPAYNRPVRLPCAASHEKMWRDDDLYNVVVEIGYNDAPPVPGMGSAIFMHVAKPDYQSTEGCVALRESDLRAVLEKCGPATRIEILSARHGDR